jgi:hypothetical protein
MYLIYDEEIAVSALASTAGERKFRVRIWMAPDRPSVIVVTPTRGGVSPITRTLKILDTIRSRFPKAMRQYHYFEVDVPGRGGYANNHSLTEVYFDSDSQGKPVMPTGIPRAWSDLNDLLGFPFDRLLWQEPK